MNSTDAARAAALPYDANTGTRCRALTVSDATITLASGVYDLHHDAAVTVYVRLGETSAALPPADNAAEVSGFPIPAGTAVTLTVDATESHAGVLHARVASSTATLSCVRKGLS